MRGAFYMGRAIAAVLNTIFPNQSTFMSKNSTPWASGSNNYGNLLSNPQFLPGGTAGTLGTGVTGGIASQWSSSQSDANVTVSAGLVSSKNYPLHNMQQLIFGGTYNKAAAYGTGAVYNSFPSNWFRMYNSTPSGSVSPGDVLEGFLYVEIPAQATLVGIGAVSMLLYNGSSQVVCSTMYPNYGAQPLDGWSGTLYLPPYTVQASDGSQFRLQIFVFYEGSGAANATAPLSGTVNVGMPVLRKMIAPTLQ